MVFTRLDKKNVSALRDRGVYYLKNFVDGYCGDISVMTWCLVNEGGFHPAHVQQALFGARRNAALKELLKRGRALIVSHVLDQPRDEWFTDGPTPLAKSDDLPDPASCAPALLGGRPLDVRGVGLLGSIFATHVQIVQQMVDGKKYELMDAHGFSTPLVEKGRILWTGGCLFEAIVDKVSFQR